MLSGDKGQKIGGALKQLDTSVTDLHSASDEGNQADAETALDLGNGLLAKIIKQAGLDMSVSKFLSAKI